MAKKVAAKKSVKVKKPATPKAVSLEFEIDGKGVYVTPTGLKYRNSREKSPSEFMADMNKGQRRALRKALDKAGFHKLSQESVNG